MSVPREVLAHGFKEAHFVNSLIEQAKADSLTFFGTEKPIPQPPQLLLQTLEKLRECGLRESQAVFIPQATLNQGDNYPGWHTKIGTDYYDWLKTGQVSKAFPELSGFWAIVDTSQRSNYFPTRELKERWEAIPEKIRPIPVYDLIPHDAVEEIIQLARQKKEIEFRDYWGPILHYLPSTSRFGVSTDEQDGIVFPRLAEKLGLTEIVKSGKAEARRPTLAEFNYLGNLARFSHLTQYGTSEAVQDIYRGITERRPNSKDSDYPPRAITSGNSRRGGVGQVDYLLIDDHADAVSFRFVIAFA